MSYIQQFFTSRDNNANAETFVGQEGRLWWDPATNQIYSSDGNTPGGIPLAGGGGGNGSPGGSNSQVQFNQAGNFGGSANLTFNSTTGTLTAVSIAGNGAGLTSITGANVTGTVADATHAGVADSANSVAGGNVTGTVANATYATSAGSATTAGTVTTAAQPNITSVGTLTSLSVSGNVQGGNLRTEGVVSALGRIISSGEIYSATQLTGGNINGANIVANGFLCATGNVTGNYYIGNGSLLTGITSNYGNANVVANLAALGTNPVSTTGNVTAGYFIGNGSALTSITGANITGTVANATYAVSSGTATSATTAATITTNAQPNITSVGTLTSATVTGNITGGNILTGGLISATGNITGGNLNAVGLSLSGNVLSTINSTANITTTGNIRAGNLIGSNLTATRIPFVGTGGVITDSIVMYTDQPNQLLYVGGGGAYIGGTGGFGTVNATRHEGSTMSATGNITGGNLRTGGLISATGNITGGNVLSNGQLSTAGNITGGNITVGGAMTAVGNIAANWVNGAYYTGTWGTDFVSTGNVSGTNITTAGLISAAGNITGSNLISTGAVYSNYNTNTANTGSFMATGGNTKGGTGYLDFLVAQNTSGGATNPYKWIRLNSDGGLEIINSAYTQNLFNLSDAGALSIPGPFSIGGKQAVNGPAFSAYAAAILQTIPNGAQTKVLFQTEEFDTNNNYTDSKFTPTVEGYYQLNAEVRLDGASGTGEMMIILYKNGSEYKRGTNQQGTQIAANFWAMQVSSMVYANGTSDYFEIYVQQGSGGSVSVTAVNAPAITWFNGCMLRGA
jgi:hypothetical protein